MAHIGPSPRRVRHRIKCHRFIVPFLKPFFYHYHFFHHIKDDAIAMEKEFPSVIKTHTHTHPFFKFMPCIYMIDLKLIQLLESPIHGCWPLYISCRSYICLIKSLMGLVINRYLKALLMCDHLSFGLCNFLCMSKVFIWLVKLQIQPFAKHLPNLVWAQSSIVISSSLLWFWLKLFSKELWVCKLWI
jgi:hypothetical protein